MTEATRAKALEKLDAFTVKIGYPDKWRDYSGLELEAGSWVGNLFAAAEFNNRFELAKIGQPVDPTEWGMSPQTVNAYYNPLGNEIVFPAAILQPPFFGLEQTLAENYGSMGAIIGHEITHGFDDMGSQFDAEGNLVNWWTDTDREEFERRAAVLVEQFNGYEALDGLFVDGELTLGENIADLGGLQMAYLAFQKRGAMELQPIVNGLTPNQQFFTAWARSWRENFRPESLKMQVLTDEHAPNHFRANGPLSNLPQFASAFRLDESAPMVRPAAERAEIW
jgi:putative endopeptidase